MEFVGKAVRKKFPGFGVFSGVIESYDQVCEFFRVVYEDGDSEELELSEIASVLKKEERRPRGRPRNRRRTVRGVAGCEIVAFRIEGSWMEEIGSRGVPDFTHVEESGFPAKVTAERGFSGDFPVEDRKEVAFGGMNEAEGLSEETLAGTGGDSKGNCSPSRVSEEGGTGSGELALRFADEEMEMGDKCLTSYANGDVRSRVFEENHCDHVADLKKDGVLTTSKETQKIDLGHPSGAESDGHLESSKIRPVGAGFRDQDSSVVQREVHMHDGESAVDLNSKDSEGNRSPRGVGKSQRDGGGGYVHKLETSDVGVMEKVEVRVGEEKESDPVVEFGTPVTRRSSKRKHLENGTSSPPVALRRSCRRAAASLSSSSAAPVTPEPSAAICVDVISNGHHGDLVDKYPPEDQRCIPSTPPLPPSSKNLDIDALPVLDIFSTYSCLRSFSTFLFLSPFTLEAYIVGLKSTFVNPLVDSIHFALLHSLKRHMKSLSGDDSSMASACLRNLDWEFLDLVTWPVYLVEYLLLSGSARNSGLQLAQLKFSRGEYYKQPVAVKLAVVRCLCDDFMDVEDIRVEIGRRALTSELYGDGDRPLNGFSATTTIGMNSRSFKKRKVSTDLAKHVLALEKDGTEGSPLRQAVAEASLENVKNDDWNSDDCCLCKMDGVLICCDGCPAAYHSRCVGVARDLLPEGDWYCPECVMDNAIGRWKSSGPLQGAALLGIDPLGRIYLATCGYLLVLTSYNGGTCYYYSKSDLKLVIEMLKSCDFMCDDIVSAILLHWEVPVDSDAKDVPPPTFRSFSGFIVSGQNDSSQLLSVHPACSVENLVEYNGTLARKNEEVLFEHNNSGVQTITASESENIGRSVAVKVEVPDTEVMDGSRVKKSARSSGEHDIPDTIDMEVEDIQLKSPILASVTEKRIDTVALSSKLPDMSEDGALKCHLDPSLYVNRYSLGQISASIAEEISHAFPNGIQNNMKKSTSETIRPLFKIFSGSGRTFSWPSVERKVVGMVQENCGWCYTCKNAGDTDCLFKLSDKNVEVICEKKAVGVRSRKNRRSHLTSIVLYILSIEERLNGLLSGPWQNPQYRKHWRKCLLKASSISAVKRQLLILEENIRDMALRGDWLKHIDSSSSLGSAFYFTTQLDDVADGSGRKRTRKAISGLDTATIRSGIHWWRGGTVSRQLFHWKMLPHSLALKGGRQAGCKKMPGILYPDASDFAKRSKRIGWRASVEFSRSVADLGRQVRDLDAHIKWENIMAVEFPLESSKRLRAWKKVTIRRKCLEGDTVKYLLDFGKRKVVPDTVTKNGIKLEDASSEKERYWLNESLVPLNLLRAYEERRLGRESKKMSLQPIHQETVKRHTSSRRDWLSRLLSKIEQCGMSVCGFCNKDLVARHAVNCQFCKGCFHRRHISVTRSNNSERCTATCYNCRDKMKVTTRVTKKKPTKVNKSWKSGPPTAEYPNLRRSARSTYKAKCKFGQKKKLKNVKGPKGSKKSRGKKVQTKGTKDAPKIHQTRSTKVHYVFWLNGLLWTKKLNDERVKKFIEANVLLPQVSESSIVTPVCFICRKTYDSRLIYVSCEICKEWFHGDSLGVTMENINNLLGFKCYKCCKRKSPVCPYSKEMTQEEASLQTTFTELKIGDALFDDDMLLSDLRKKPRLLPFEECQNICCEMTITPAEVPVTDIDPCETLCLDGGVQVEESMTSL